MTLVLAVSAAAFAQTGGGSIRGYVKDEQGGVLPGVTVTATSPEMLGPVTAVTDADGYYRLLNLPPGTYTVTAELAGFATFRREGVLLRAGANFQVDIVMKLGAIEETITVSGESPMIEVTRPGNVLNIDGEFQKHMPIASRRNWTDFLELTPGVHSRPFDDGSGRMVYFGHATEHFAHVVQLEGMQAGNYNDFQLTYVQMGSDMIQDTQVKTGGVDASTPMGVGLAINVITKSGGNTFKGTAGYAYQPLEWNGDNTKATTVFKLPPEVRQYSSCPNGECVSTGGTPAQSGIRQLDASLGGPIKRDKVWFFGSFRVSRVEVPIARIQKQVDDIKFYFPDRKLFNNEVKGYQPYLKVTAKLGQGHELAAIFQRDRVDGTSSWEYNFDRIWVYSNGGNLYSAKLTSVWGSNLTTTFLAGYNDKGGADENTYKAWGETFSGPLITVHSSAAISGRAHPRQRPHSRRRQPGHREPAAVFARLPAGRPDVVQAGLGRLARVPDGVLRRAEQHLRPHHPLHEQRVHLGGGGPTRPARSPQAGAVPPAVCGSTRADAPDAQGARPELGGLRAGQLEADAAPHGEPRHPRRLRQARRQDLQRHAGERVDDPAAPRLHLHADRRRTQHPARELRPGRRAGDGPRRDHELRGVEQGLVPGRV